MTIRSERTPWDEDEGGCVVCQRHAADCGCHEDIANDANGVRDALTEYLRESSHSLGAKEQTRADLNLLSKLRPYFVKSGSGVKCGGPTVDDPDRPYCKPDQSCCDFTCGN